MYERLLDKSKQPSIEDLEIYCGENKDNFIALNNYLSENFFTIQEVRFPYGNNYGWCITHRKGKKLICDVFAEAGAFTVMLRLSDQQFESVYSRLLEYSKKYIDNCYPCGNGGWIHYQVTNSDYLEDIKILLETKLK